MSTKYNQKGIKSENRSTYTSQIYPLKTGGNHRTAIGSKSPKVFYSKKKKKKKIQPIIQLYQVIPVSIDIPTRTRMLSKISHTI